MIPLPQHLIDSLGKEAKDAASQIYPDNAEDYYDPSGHQRDAFLQGVAWERLRARVAQEGK